MTFRPSFISLAATCLILTYRPLSNAAAQTESSGYNAQIAAAQHELDSRDFAGAASTLSQLLRADSHSGADTYRLLAFAQFQQDEIYTALSTCEKGIVIYPGSEPLSELYVSVLRKAAFAEDRRARLQIAIQWAPDSPSLAKALGVDLLSANSTDPRAMQLLSHAIQLAPRDAEAHFFYGESACFSQSDDICIKELRLAHDLDPTNEQANMQLFTMIAVVEDKQGHAEQASSYFASAMKANRTLPKPSAYAAFKYVTFLITENKQKQAMDLVDEILRWAPSYGPAHFERAKSFSERGRKQDAIQEAELAIASSQNSSEQLRSYHYFLAKTYFALGRREDAQAHMNWVEAHPQN